MFKKGINLTKSNRIVRREKNAAASFTGFLFKKRKLSDSIEGCSEFGDLVMSELKISSEKDQYINDIINSLLALAYLAENKENHPRILKDNYLS